MKDTKDPGARFRDLPLRQELREALEYIGYDRAMPVQERVLLEGRNRDLIVQARTGSGKTLAYGLILLDDMEIGERRHRVLILCPTRELAAQVAEEVAKIGKALDLHTTAIVGGAPMPPQIEALDRGSAVIAGTPGRVLDLMRRDVLHAGQVTAVVLDEADRLLDMGFRDEIETILHQVRKRKRTILGSATMPFSVMALVRRHTRNALRLEIDSTEDAHTDIDHRMYVVPGTKRFEGFLNVLHYEEAERAIIFGTTRAETSALSDRLVKAGYPAALLSGELSQRKRDRTMDRFRKGHLKYLVATDVAARGIDVSDLSHIFHYRMPQDSETYVHRSGRTGRAGSKGRSVVVVSSTETLEFEKLDRKLPVAFDVREVPVPATFESEGRQVPAEVSDGLLELIAMERSYAERQTPGLQKALDRQLGDGPVEKDLDRGPRERPKRRGPPVVDLRNARLEGLAGGGSIRVGGGTPRKRSPGRGQRRRRR